MRIIAGKYRSRTIEAPKGNQTRPTLDQVREAVFSHLGQSFTQGDFLDLYAGSGANAIEAISRGFTSAVCVDLAYLAIQAIRQNIQSLNIDQIEVLKMPAKKALTVLATNHRQFDVIYMDPPFAKQENAWMIEQIDQLQLLKEDGIIVVESTKEDVFPSQIRQMEQYKQVQYGRCQITYYRKRKV